MLKKIILFIAIVTIAGNSFVKADEGMWIPILLKKYNIADMQKKGFKLTAEDIYSVNKACMKDAIVIFGRGCTGELISEQGLLITNHHCGYGQIQTHSSVEHDYLTDGFWAKNKNEELSNPGLTVTFLVRIEDVSERILSDIDENTDEKERQTKIQSEIKKLQNEASKDNQYKIEIKPFYYGNEYYMFVYEIFTDVRLVGAPPSAIGKFGGDTDNWMWPRHTGDFSLFRIYADKDNKPADYSPDNVPYKPKYHFPVSLDGIKEGDFTMVFGYPGTTEQFLTSYAVKQLMEVTNPSRIEVRQKKLDIMRSFMDNDTKTRIQYSTKYAHVSNAWKKWIGENRGLKRLNAIEKKIKLEKQFQEWANADTKRKEMYGNLLPEYEKLYKDIEPFQKTIAYLYEVPFFLDIFKMVSQVTRLGNQNTKPIEQRVEGVKKSVKATLKNYNIETDKKLFAELIKIYYEKTDKEYHPEFYNTVIKKYKGDFNKYTNDVYSKSIFTDKEKLDNFLDNYTEKSDKKLQKDPLYNINNQFINIYLLKVFYNYRSLNDKINKLHRLYVKGMKEMQADKLFYPDANFTMRIAYGKVDDYQPKDGVRYKLNTTLKGIIEKDNPDIYDYNVPEKLKELYNKKEYGRYGINSTMPVCFTATNHTTGGNSGSPVLNARGELIGINFDRNWEGTMSDIMYDPEMCRNISLDIRYALFIIDKFAGAKHIVDEMTLVKTKPYVPGTIRTPLEAIPEKAKLNNIDK